MRSRGVRPAVFFVAAVLAVLAVWAVASGPAAGAEPAPGWTLTDIDGNNVSSSALRGRTVVLEFSGTWCEPCRIVEAAFIDMQPGYDDSEVVFLSVFIPPGNSAANLVNHRQNRGLTWHVAEDTDQVQLRYSVTTLPRVFVVNAQGYVTKDWAPAVGFSAASVERDMRTAISQSQAGAAGITITALSIPALLVVAAFLSFFSPCSFPVLPAFMAYYLKLDAGGTKASTQVAAGRGFVASLGIVAVYGLIALAVFAAGLAAAAFIPFISPVMGVVLITFGILALLPFQYHWLTRPFVALKNKIASRFGGKWQPGIRTKLFAFGAGYGAAGFACVAPPFIGAVLNASALGAPDQAFLGLGLYVAIVIALMVSVTVALHVAGDRALKKIRAWSAAMKYVSAAALIIAGGYLLYLFYVAYTA